MSSDNLKKEDECRKTLTDLLNKEEIFWKQKNLELIGSRMVIGVQSLSSCLQLFNEGITL